MMVIAACSDETRRGCELNWRGRKRWLVSLRDKLGFRGWVFISIRIVEAAVKVKSGLGVHCVGLSYLSGLSPLK